MSIHDNQVAAKIRELWQAGKVDLLPPSSVDPVALLRRVYNALPPEEIAEYYRCVPGGSAFGLPLIGVHFAQPGTSLIEGLETFDAMVQNGYWPLAGDGFGNYYVGFILNGRVVVGFVEALKDATKPERVVASSIAKLLDGLASQIDKDSEWPWGEAVRTLDPDQTDLDRLYQAQER